MADDPIVQKNQNHEPPSVDLGRTDLHIRVDHPSKQPHQVPVAQQVVNDPPLGEKIEVSIMVPIKRDEEVKLEALQKSLEVDRELLEQRRKKEAEEEEKERDAVRRQALAEPIDQATRKEKSLWSMDPERAALWSIDRKELLKQIAVAEQQSLELKGDAFLENRRGTTALYLVLIEKDIESKRSVSQGMIEGLGNAVTDTINAAEDLKAPVSFRELHGVAEVAKQILAARETNTETRLRSAELAIGLLDDVRHFNLKTLSANESTALLLLSAELRTLTASNAESLKSYDRTADDIRLKSVTAAQALSEIPLESRTELIDAQQLRAILNARDVEGTRFKEYLIPEIREIRKERSERDEDYSSLIPEAERRLIDRLAKKLSESADPEISALALSVQAQRAIESGKRELALNLIEQSLQQSPDSETVLRLTMVSLELQALERAREIAARLEPETLAAQRAQELIVEATKKLDPEVKSFIQRAEELQIEINDSRNALFNGITLRSSGLNFPLAAEEGSRVTVQTAQDVSDIAAKLFGVPKEALHSMHLRLLAQGNPQFADQFMAGQGEIPAGSVININLTPEGAKLSRAEAEAEVLALRMSLDEHVLKTLSIGEPLSAEAHKKAEEMLVSATAKLNILERTETIITTLDRITELEVKALQFNDGINNESFSLLKKEIKDLLNSPDPALRAAAGELLGEAILSEAKCSVHEAEKFIKTDDLAGFEKSINGSIKVLKEALREGSLSGLQHLEVMQKLAGISVYKARSLSRYRVFEELEYERSLPDYIRNQATVTRLEREASRVQGEIKDSLDGVKVELTQAYGKAELTKDFQNLLRNIEVEKYALIGDTYRVEGEGDKALQNYRQQVAAFMGIASDSIMPKDERNISKSGEELGGLASFFRSDTQVKFLTNEQIIDVARTYNDLTAAEQSQAVVLLSRFTDYAGSRGDTDTVNASRQIFEVIAQQARTNLIAATTPEERSREQSILVQTEIAKGNYLVAIGALDQAAATMAVAHSLALGIESSEVRSRAVKEATYSEIGALQGLAISGDYEGQREAALRIRSLRIEAESGSDKLFTDREIAYLTVVEANTFLKIKEATFARESFTDLEKNAERYKEIDYVTTALEKVRTAGPESFGAALQVALSEANSETLGEALGYGLGGTLAGAGAGAAIGVWFFGVGALPGAAVGALLGGATGTGYLKIRNVSRGWDRVEDAYSTGMTDISVKQSVFDTMFLAADVASICAPIKGAGTALKGGVKIGAEAISEISEAEAKTLLRQQLAKDFVSETTAFGGKAITALTVAGVALPVTDAAITISQLELTPEEKKILFDALKKEGAAALSVAVVYGAANYSIGKLVDDPIKIIEKLRKGINETPEFSKIELEDFGKPQLETKPEIPKIKTTDDDSAWLKEMQEAFDNAREPNREIQNRPPEDLGGGSKGSESPKLEPEETPKWKPPSDSFEPPKEEFELALEKEEKNVAVLDEPETPAQTKRGNKADQIDDEHVPTAEELERWFKEETYEPPVKTPEPEVKNKPEVTPVRTPLEGKPEPVREVPLQPRPEPQPKLETQPQLKPQLEAEPKATPHPHPEPQPRPDPEPQKVPRPDPGPSLKTDTETETKRKRRQGGFGFEMDWVEYPSKSGELSMPRFNVMKFKPEGIELPGKERRKRNVLKWDYDPVEKKVKKTETEQSESLYSLKKRPHDKIFPVSEGDQVEKIVSEVDYEAHSSSVEKLEFVIDDDG